MARARGSSSQRRRFLFLTVVATMAATLLTVPGRAGATPPSVPAPAGCVDVQPDVAAARRMVAVCGRRVELLAERTEYSQTFLNADGSHTLEQTLEPTRVRKGQSWVPVDTVLKASPDGVTPRASVLPMVFSGGGDGPFARLRDGTRELAMSWPGPLPAPELAGSTATYRNVLPDVDLRVTAEAVGFSEVVVVRSRQAAANPKLAALRFGLAVKGVTVKPAAGGGLTARDERGETVFASPAPLMWDSSETESAAGGPVEPRKGERSATPLRKPTQTVPETEQPNRSAERRATAPASVPDGSGRAVLPVRVDAGTLTVVPDKAMLTDPRAKLPLFIDPSWTGGISGNAWTSVWSKHKSSSFWKNSSALTNGSTFGSAGAGRTEDCSGCADHIVRSLFQMNTSNVRGKQILGATFRIEQRHAWTCSPKSNAKLWMTGSISSGTTWNNQPTWNSSYTAQTAANRKVGSAHGCLGSGTIEFNVKTMVAKAAASNWSTLTVGIRAVDEGTKNQWKRFNHSSPKLAITYNTAPTAPGERYSDGKPCATGSARPYVRTLTPIMAAKQVDPDNDQGLTTWFYWWQSGGTRSDSNRVSQAAGNKTSVSKAVPAGRLSDGATYIWQARTADAHSTGGWSATCEFTVDVTPPGVPAQVSSAEYPPSAPTTPAGGGVGIEGRFAITPPSTGAGEVVGYAWTLDTATQPSAAAQVPASGSQPVTISYLPLRDGVHTLRVWAKDRAGWYSSTPYTYTFSVRAGSGPAAQWAFDEASGAATDDTGHDNTMTLSSTATRAPGRSGVGSALALNGSTAAATMTGPVMTPNPATGEAVPVRTDASFTVTARVRLTSTSGVTGQRTAVAAFGSRTSAYSLGYSGPDNRWRFTMAGADADNPALYSVLSDSAPTADRWTHLAATYDAATKKLTLYVNGVAQTATATLTGGFNASTGVAVGKRRWNGADDGFLNGAVDDVRVYNFVEATSELTKLALPLPLAVSLPGGDTVGVGAAATALLSAGGDTNIVSYRYSIGSPALNQTATPSPNGASVSVPLSTTIAGAVTIYAVAVDGLGRQSPTLGIAQLTVRQPATLTGFVTDGDFVPLPGATVRLEPGGHTATVDADGSYLLTGFSAGTYTVRATHGGVCGLSAVAEGVEISGEAYLDLMLTQTTDELGYGCASQPAAFGPANGSVLALTGDDAVTTVALPFAFPFYGGAYRSAWVDTNGLLSFTDPGGSHPNTGSGQLPAPAEPNAVVAPFWDDLVVDSSASVRTATTGTGSDQRFVVEWRNVHRKASTAQRLSFEVILAPDGTVTTNYDQLDNDAEKGANAIVGIEAAAGEDGLSYSVRQPALAANRAVTFNRPEAAGALEKYQLSGTLTNASGAAVVGATVTLDPSGLTATTGVGGAYSFTGLVADSYNVSAKLAGRCGAAVRSQVELAADTVRNLQLGPDYGGLGYACAVGASGFVAAANVLALTGDDAVTSVTLPFPVRFHGESYSTGRVHTNGLVSFGAVSGEPDTWANPTMPTAVAPNAVVAPFWDDFEVDASASVRTQTVGTAPNRSFVVEWRNVGFRPTKAERVTFEVIFHEDGRIAYHYGAMSTPTQTGAGATVGLENASGTVAALYSFQEAVLTANSSITYTPAPVGTVRGTLTTAVTAQPYAGATVTLNPGGRSTTTGADGSYQFTGVPVGQYTLATSTGDSRCVGQAGKEVINHPGGTSDVALSVMVDGDEFGYKCTTGSQTFVPGDVVEGWSGDETVWQKNPPFPVKLYGESYTSAWISANGLISFKDPAYFGWIGSAPGTIPSEAVEGSPNAAVYVLWDDWVIDSQAKIATKISGTAPNRQWVVEWRNVHLYNDTNTRVTFEAIFTEGGDVTLAYSGIDAAKAVERGAEATVGIENADGSIAFQYLHREALLATGQGVTFKPNPPGQGSVTGTVTCQGAPVAGATVAVAGRSATSAADGTYQITAVPAGSWAVVATVTTGACKGSEVRQVVVGTNTQVAADYPLAATAAGGGYTLTEQPVTYTAANTTVLPLTGDDAYTTVSLPFPVRLYGQTYQTGYVDINGLVSFVNPGVPSPDAWPIPSAASPEEPNAALYPFWHDWVVDANASVRTAVRGTAPNRQFVIEWRNVHSYEDPRTRITFQAILDEAGGYSFAYTDNDGTFLERGGGATVGIENADGTAALQYTYRQPVLRPGFGLRINPPVA